MKRYNIIEIQIEIDDGNISEIDSPREKDVLDDILEMGFYVKDDDIAISKPSIDPQWNLAFVYLIVYEPHPLFNLLSFLHYKGSDNADLNDEYQDSFIEALYKLYRHVQEDVFPSYGIDINSIGKLQNEI